MTACGGNFISSEVARNKRSPQWEAAPIESAEMPMSAYEIVMICIAATGLLLKMISILMDRNQK